jgi:hypothetical protein
VTATAILAALLAACSPATTTGQAPSGETPGTETPAAENENPVPAVTCDDVAVAVAAYIDGLEARIDNGVDEYGATCAWESPAGVTDLADIRSVEVLISVEPADGLTAEDLTAAGLTPLPDVAIEAAGGIAYTSDVEVSVASVIVTTVVLPDVEVIVTGGKWDGRPSLDGPASLVVAKTVEGEIGFMSGHEPVLAILAEGQVRITEPSGSKIIANAQDGFLSMEGDVLTIVAGNAALIS